MDLQGENGQADDDDDIDALERRATIAKREAQAKNKKIPPFVQKLSRFVHPVAATRSVSNWQIVFLMNHEIPISSGGLTTETRSSSLTKMNLQGP